MKLHNIMLCVSLFSCSLKKTNHNNTSIVGIVKDIPAKKIYLTDAYNWKVFLDSSDYKNDTFSFQIKKNNFEPFIVSVCFLNNEGKIQQLVYENYILSTADNKYGSTSFVIDKGTTKISGRFISKQDVKGDRLKITGSKQNDAYFSTQLSDFGWINTNDKLERGKIINKYKRLIKQYPYSYHFITMLYNYRTEYTNEELLDMLDLFDDEAKSFSCMQKFYFYFKEKPSPGKPLKNYIFYDSFNQPKSTINDSVNLNIIIFWASWCGPCRKEIPKLKEIYNTFKNRNIHMVSVSIDEDKEMWRLALLKENMQWQQLVVDSSILDKVKSSFNFSSIPFIVFADNKGIEIARFSGYNPDNKDEYTPVIEKYMKDFHD